jgi:ketosteroid isomerase-like protein
MKANIFVATLLLFILGGCTSKQNDQLTLQQIEQIKSEVKAAGEPLMSSWAKLDADKALQCYSPEMFACMDTLLINYQTYAKGWQGYTQSASSIKLTPIKEDNIVLTKDYVISTWVGKVEIEQKSGDKITYNPIRYTDIWKKADGQWKIIFEQSSGTPVIQVAEKK